ncbi:MAG: pilus assembly PilX N-terminal domain-containing protein [Phycisphaerae bacterium]|nr:pilus assembly PilX N-terminal domain-containing protein [Phycisphaerae bacterium]
MKNKFRTKKTSSRKGAAYLMSLIVLAVLTALGVGLADMGVQEFRKADNQTQSAAARLAAESGMNFAIYTLKDCQSDRTLGDLPDMLELVKTHLQTKLPGATISEVTQSGINMIYVAPISYEDGRSFSMLVYVSAVDPDDPSIATEMQLITTGYTGGTSRTLGLTFEVDSNKDLLNYAIASRNRMTLRGLNTEINGNIACSWIRTWCGSGHAYPFDIGHTNSTLRAQEGITITGEIHTVMSEEEFYGEESGYSDSRPGIRFPDIFDKIVFDSPPVMDLTHEDFDTSMHQNPSNSLAYNQSNSQSLVTDDSNYKDGSGNWLHGYPNEFGDWVVLPEGQSSIMIDGESVYCPPFYQSSGYIKWSNQRSSKPSYEYVTTPAPNPDSPRVTYEYWSHSRSYWRSRYDGTESTPMVFNDIHVPCGSHAHFRNCTFNGITYIATDESSDLSNWETYARYTNIRSGYSNSEGANNIVFENCTFNGPIVSGVPKHCRFKEYAIGFTGNTVFNASAIQSALAGATILAPNFNINIGDFDESSGSSDSRIVGLVVGSIIDIRDNAVVDGTILSMADLDYVSDTGTGFASNIGNCELSGESAGGLVLGSQTFAHSGSIILTPDPENVVPLGIFKRYTVIPMMSTYTEYTE